MGTIEIIDQQQLLLKAHIITYGASATAELTEMMRQEIEEMWNEPKGIVSFQNQAYYLCFQITAAHIPYLEPEEIIHNTNPQNNYFRIEEFAHGNISFVDALGCNTGYFKLENLYKGSTTAAHEFGHTLGLAHPTNLDLRGKGVPGIMYPRGTIVDPEFQYEPTAIAGQKGGTMHPMYRKVKKEDVALLRIDALLSNKMHVIGAFSSQWHEAHDSNDVV